MMRCPKCRSTTLELIEVFEEIETRIVVNGVVSRGSSKEPGSILRTECCCENCSHTWVPRSATLDSLERD